VNISTPLAVAGDDLAQKVGQTRRVYEEAGVGGLSQ